MESGLAFNDACSVYSALVRGPNQTSEDDAYQNELRRSSFIEAADEHADASDREFLVCAFW